MYKLYKSIRFNTVYLVKGRAVYFYSVVKEKFLPTTRSLQNLENAAILIGKNFKPNFMNKAFTHVK